MKSGLEWIRKGVPVCLSRVFVCSKASFMQNTCMLVILLVKNLPYFMLLVFHFIFQNALKWIQIGLDRIRSLFSS